VHTRPRIRTFTAYQSFKHGVPIALHTLRALPRVLARRTEPLPLCLLATAGQVEYPRAIVFGEADVTALGGVLLDRGKP